MNITRKNIEERNKILLECKDSFLIQNFLDNLKKQFPEYTLETYYDVDEFIEVVHRGELFNNGNKIIALMELNSDILKVVSPLVNTETLDILVFVEQKVLSKTKLYTNFKAECNVIKLELPSEKECSDWVKGVLNSKKMVYDRTVPDILVNRKGADLSALEREIRKLEIIYETSYISNKACDIVSGTSEAKFFSLVELYLMKDLNKAMVEFEKIDEYSYIKMIYVFINYIEKLYKVATLKEQGKSQDEIAEITGINKYFLRTKYYAILAVYNKVKLIRLLDSLNELDFKLRQNTLPNKLLVEAYLFKALKF